MGLRGPGGEGGRELGQKEDGRAGERRGWAVAEGLALQGRPVVCEPAGTWAHLNSIQERALEEHQRRGPQQVGPGSPVGPLPCLASLRGRGGVVSGLPPTPS